MHVIKDISLSVGEKGGGGSCHRSMLKSAFYSGLNKGIPSNDEVTLIPDRKNTHCSTSGKKHLLQAAK